MAGYWAPKPAIEESFDLEAEIEALPSLRARSPVLQQRSRLLRLYPHQAHPIPPAPRPPIRHISGSSQRLHGHRKCPCQYVARDAIMERKGQATRRGLSSKLPPCVARSEATRAWNPMV